MKNVPFVVVILAIVLTAVVTRVFAQTTVPSSFGRPSDARFRLLAEEGILQPDGRTYVTGTKIWTVADKASGQCHLILFTGTGTAMSGPIACP